MSAALPPADTRQGDWAFIIVPAGHRRVWRVRLGRALRQRAAVGGLLATLLAMWGLVEVAYWRAQAGRLPAAASEVARLSRRLRGVEGELTALDSTLRKMEATTARIAAITQLNDPERNLRLGPFAADSARPGPVLYARGERIDAEDELLDGRAGMAVLDHAITHTRDLAQSVEANQRSVLGFLAAHEGLLRTTPSIFPLASHLICGDFGSRLDLFTGQQVVHKGIDLLAELGAPVWAPADGRVVFVGRRGEGYGEAVVLDHGFGVQTHFGHLQRIAVGEGDVLKRGQAFAEVGQTGRTTGTYLHYEVRLGGLPEDPRRFLLDD